MNRASATVATGADGFASRDFLQAVRAEEPAGLRRGRVRTLQVNVGRLCNMACHHCHVDAGPKRREIMPLGVARQVIGLLEANAQVETLDLTGGAPEMNPGFRFMVTEARRLGRRVIDRCNLTVLLEKGFEDLPEFLAANRVRVVASLPCYEGENVDRQRGNGTFLKSLVALRRLNELGYGTGNPDLPLELVFNPVGAGLPPDQAELEARYKQELRARFGLHFDRLLTITNMPVKRFANWLERNGRLEEYMSLLVNHFHPATLPGLMCRSLLSVGWDGRVHDCDFNQMLDIPLGAPGVTGLADLADLDRLEGVDIATGDHCFGCTAGAGSSCTGALR